MSSPAKANRSEQSEPSRDEQPTNHYLVESVPLYHRKVVGLNPELNGGVDLKRLDPKGGTPRYQCACGAFFDAHEAAIDHLRQRYLDDSSAVFTENDQ